MSPAVTIFRSHGTGLIRQRISRKSLTWNIEKSSPEAQTDPPLSARRESLPRYAASLLSHSNRSYGHILSAMQRLRSSEHELSERRFFYGKTAPLAFCKRSRLHFILFQARAIQPIMLLMSLSTSVMPPMPKVSTSTFATFGERNAGSVGPRWMFFTPRCKSARRTMTAFCSYHAML